MNEKEAINFEMDTNINTFSFNKYLNTILKYTPAFVILLYAFIYLTGYFYLYSYFDYWGINTIEIGFTIIDYATIAIYPLMIIFSFSSITYIFGYFLYYIIENSKKAKFNKSKKTYNVFTYLFYFLIIPTLFVSSFWVSVISGNPIISFVTISEMFSVLFYYFGYFSKFHKNNRSIISFYILIFIIIIFIIGIPLSSFVMGREFASTHRKYSFTPPLSFPEELQHVIIFANHNIGDLKAFEFAENQYEGLMLLAHKDNQYYFVIDIVSFTEKHKKVSYEYNGEIKKLSKDQDDLMIEVNKKLKSMDIKNVYLKNMLEDIEINIKKIIGLPFNKEREDLRNKVSANLGQVDQSLKIDSNESSQIKDL
ncbi:MAG: hypothetical protein ABR968_13110, partial [Bacteroidales bacterium]